jgi:hypothetical protein
MTWNGVKVSRCPAEMYGSLMVMKVLQKKRHDEGPTRNKEAPAQVRNAHGLRENVRLAYLSSLSRSR